MKKLTKRQQAEYDKLSSLEKAFYEPKYHSSDMAEILKELYSPDLLKDLVYTRNPLLELIKDKK